MAEGEKFLGYNQIDQINLDDVGIILDKSDTTQSTEGSTKYYTKQQLIDFVNRFANRSVENSYSTVQVMLNDQVSQSSGNIQFVENATADPNISNGAAYYEYLGTIDEDLEDYRVLSTTEVLVLENSLDYLTLFVRAKAASFSNYQMDLGQMLTTVQDGNITSIIFDFSYSKYLLKVKTLLEAGKAVSFLFPNLSQNRLFYAEVSSFELVQNDAYIKANFSNTIPTADLNIDDVLQCFLPQVSIPQTGGKKVFTATANDQEDFTFLTTDTPFNPRIVIVDGIATEDYTYNSSTNTLTITDGVFNGAKISLIQ